MKTADFVRGAQIAAGLYLATGATPATADPATTPSSVPAPAQVAEPLTQDQMQAQYDALVNTETNTRRMHFIKTHTTPADFEPVQTPGQPDAPPDMDKLADKLAGIKLGAMSNVVDLPKDPDDLSTIKRAVLTTMKDGLDIYQTEQEVAKAPPDSSLTADRLNTLKGKIAEADAAQKTIDTYINTGVVIHPASIGPATDAEAPTSASPAPSVQTPAPAQGIGH